MNWEKFKIENAAGLTVEAQMPAGDSPQGRQYGKARELTSRLWDGYFLSSIKILTELHTDADCEKLITFLQVHKRCLRSIKP